MLDITKKMERLEQSQQKLEQGLKRMEQGQLRLEQKLNEDEHVRLCSSVSIMKMIEGLEQRLELLSDLHAAHVDRSLQRE